MVGVPPAIRKPPYDVRQCKTWRNKFFFTDQGLWLFGPGEGKGPLILPQARCQSRRRSRSGGQFGSSWGGFGSRWWQNLPTFVWEGAQCSVSAKGPSKTSGFGTLLNPIKSDYIYKHEIQLNPTCLSHFFTQFSQEFSALSGFKLAEGTMVTFRLYVDNLGAGALDVTMA